MKIMLIVLMMTVIPYEGTETTVTDSKGTVLYHEETGIGRVVTWDDVSVTYWDDI